MLARWTESAGQYQGVEKAHVEKAVTAMPGVIDLEMGLPAYEEQKTALRMDLVALERDNSALNIVFWEVKMIGDGRLRARGEPEVFRQIKAYEDYLACWERRQRVIEAYRRTCRLFRDFGEVAHHALGTPLVDPIVYEAATDNSPLTIDETPRLMIFDDGLPRNEQAWQAHLARLEQRTRVSLVPVDGFQLTVAA